MITDLGPEALPAVAELCRTSFGDAAPTRDELARALFDPERPATLRGDPERGVVATVVRHGTGFVRLLVVDPLHRRRGFGSQLLAAGEADLGGLASIAVGSDAPDHLFPGSPLRETGLVTLLEARGYQRTGVALNLDVPPDAQLQSSPGIIDAGSDDAEELLDWVRGHYPHWEDETERSLRRGSVVLSRDDSGLTGFCAWGANRAAWFGPMAVDPKRRGTGLGAPLARAALTRMRAEGHRRIQVAWVTSVAFYAKAVGATVGDAYLLCSKAMADR